MGADGKSAEIGAVPLLTIEPDTDNAGVGNSSFSQSGYSLAEFFYDLEMILNEKEKEYVWNDILLFVESNLSGIKSQT